MSGLDGGQAPMLDLVQRFRQLRVLVIGDAMLDTYLEGEATRLCSEGPVPVVRKTAEHRIPGGAANTAANLAALDAEVMFLSVVGCDIAGTLLRETLREHGVSDAWLIEDAAMPTQHKLRILANGQYMVRFDEGETLHTPDTQAQLLAHLEALYPCCDLVLISDYRYGVVSEELIERLQALHAAQPKVLLVDSKALERFCSVQATVVTPNYQEACHLTSSLKRDQSSNMNSEGSFLSEDLADVENVAGQLLTLLASEHVAVTLGERGVFLLNRQGRARHIPAHPVDHANDVGAGDSFAAAMALALAAGGSMEEAAQIAIDAAGLAVTKRWTAVVHHQELLQRVSLREYARRACAPTSGQPIDGASALNRLVAQLDAERRAGSRIVFTNGVFDILHAGHVQFLQQAKALGHVLVVGVNSDNSARRLKGMGRPINSARDRMALVAALDAVDHVVLFDEDTPTQLISLLRPDIHVKGGDYTYEALPEAEAVRECGGRIIILPLAGSVSTSSVIERIAALTSHESEQLQGGTR